MAAWDSLMALRGNRAPQKRWTRSAREMDFSGISRGYSSPILLAIGSDVRPQVVMTVNYRTSKVNILPAK
jgi:hypothetical protein